ARRVPPRSVPHPREGFQPASLVGDASARSDTEVWRVSAESATSDPHVSFSDVSTLAPASSGSRRLSRGVHPAPRARSGLAATIRPALRVVGPAVPVRPSSSHDEVHELARHDDRLADLLAVELGLNAGRRLRPLDQLGLGEIGRDLDTVANPAVDLDHELERLALEQRLVGDGPWLLP